MGVNWREVTALSLLTVLLTALGIPSAWWTRTIARPWPSTQLLDGNRDDGLVRMAAGPWAESRTRM
jgi:hypothetical protein